MVCIHESVMKIIVDLICDDRKDKINCISISNIPQAVIGTVSVQFQIICIKTGL